MIMEIFAWELERYTQEKERYSTQHITREIAPPEADVAAAPPQSKRGKTFQLGESEGNSLFRDSHLNLKNCFIVLVMIKILKTSHKICAWLKTQKQKSP